jgi:hypothetical protein
VRTLSALILGATVCAAGLPLAGAQGEKQSGIKGGIEATVKKVDAEKGKPGDADSQPSTFRAASLSCSGRAWICAAVPPKPTTKASGTARSVLGLED